jgi:REP element-mobilizing transposase RayT
MVQRVKGRLQHLLQSHGYNSFRRNYCLRSIGSTRREVVDRYLASQLDHHQVTDPRVKALLSKYQIHDPLVDLSRPRFTAHAQYWYNLHLVLVNEQRHRETSDCYFSALNTWIRRIAKAKNHRLARGALLPDHLHLTLGCGLESSPEEVALSYLNNLAYALGMKHVFRNSYFVGTFGEYDLGVVPR